MPNWFDKHSKFLTFKFGNVIDDYQYIKPSFFENKGEKKSSLDILVLTTTSL
jgi:hypothetical protein